MTRSRVASLETELLGIKSLDDEATERRFLRVVEQLTRLRTEAALGALFARVEDREHDIQECLVHAVESFPPKMYVTALVRELLALHQRAPYRTSILVSRIMQSEPDRRALAATMAGAGPEIQRALESALAALREARPDLGQTVDRMIAMVRSRTGGRASRPRGSYSQLTSGR